MPDAIPETLVEVVRGSLRAASGKRGCVCLEMSQQESDGPCDACCRAIVAALLAHPKAREYVLEEAVAGMDEYPDTDGECEVEIPEDAEFWAKCLEADDA